jgi:hypothetical protein
LPDCHIAGNERLPASRIATLPANTTENFFAPDQIAKLAKARIAILPAIWQYGNMAIWQQGKKCFHFARALYEASSTRRLPVCWQLSVPYCHIAGNMASIN